jgi:hypothetical protein
LNSNRWVRTWRQEAAEEPRLNHPRTEATMLVLSRFAGESIIIDGDITVTVLEVFRDRVRIGITAPKSVPV